MQARIDAHSPQKSSNVEEIVEFQVGVQESLFDPQPEFVSESVSKDSLVSEKIFNGHLVLHKVVELSES